MPRTREVLASAVRQTGRVATISTKPLTESVFMRFVMRMTDAARKNVDNTVDFYLYGSDDNFITRQFLGAVNGWRGGTYIDKQGIEQTMPPPVIELEMTAQNKELDILSEVETGASFRYAVDCEEL